MTSVSPPSVEIVVRYLRNAREIYGGQGLAPATGGSAGADLRACPADGGVIVIAPGERAPVPSGIAVEPREPGFAGFVYSRSGLGAVIGLTVAQGVGVIDPDYRGEITVFLLNTGKETQTVKPGDRIAQLVFQACRQPRFFEADSLSETARGSGGFGHTGRG